MITFILNALKIIFVLGFLILIHEGGHFLVAKLCKVLVKEFSIGFGPKILRKQGKETLYTLRLIPLGGFVNLEGEEERSDKEGSFSNASILKRIAIVMAGGIVNIVFGLIVYFILIISTGNNTSLIINETIPEYSAQIAGLQENDEIIKINGKKIYIKSDIDKILENSNGEKLELTIKRNNELINVDIEPTRKEYKSTGIYLKSNSSGESTKIVTIGANSVAEKEGLKANDEIIRINKKEVRNQEQIIQYINEENIQELEIVVKRGNEEIEIILVPDIMYNYYLGIYFKTAENTIGNNLYYALFETKDFAVSIIDNIKMLFTGNVRVDQMMGPVGISEVVAKTNDISDFIYILALISLSLGVTNLLPIPALDGGKILILLIEAIRRKKLSERTEINIQLFGFACLIVLSLYITYNDILRLF